MPGLRVSCATDSVPGGRRFARPDILQAGRARSRRPLLVGFATAAAIAAILLLPRGEDLSEESTLRDPVAEEFRLRAPVETESAWQLSWSAPPAAEVYELRIYDVELKELFQLGPLREPTASLEKSALELEPTLLWRVYAFEAGDEIWRSEVGVLRQVD